MPAYKIGRLWKFKKDEVDQWVRSGGAAAGNKEEYLSTMEHSPVKDVEIKVLLKKALIDRIDDRALFMKGIDVSYFYEGYSEFKTDEL